MDIIDELKGKVIVSSQASAGEPFYDMQAMKAMMQSVINGGAAGLRVAGNRDIKLAKEFGVTVIGLTKPEPLPVNWKEVVYITPTLTEVNEIIEAGADIVAFDGTSRKRQNNCTLSEILSLIHSKGKLAMADIATLEEGINCAKLGVDIISTTLSGYTQESLSDSDKPDFKLLQELVNSIDKPVFLEGRIWEVEDVRKAFELGAHSVVIGSAITRPHLITKRFVNYNN